MSRPRKWVTPVAPGIALLALALAVSLAPTGPLAPAVDLSPGNWLAATAYVVPKETAPQGEGYNSLVEGHNGRLYIGTHAQALNCWLVEFDPITERMRIVVDVMQEIGSKATGFAAQSKIHTRNNVGASGKIYFGTKQGYPGPDEKPEDYPGGYPMVYDPQTGRTRVYPIPVPHQGIISIAPDESRGGAYLSTCSDDRPVDHTHFLILDLETGRYTDLGDMEHMYAFIVVDYRGRAYHPIRGGDIARYDPRRGRLERLAQTIDGQPPTAESLLAVPEGYLINWDLSPDRKTLYAVPLSSNYLYAYDLTAAGKTLPGRCLGSLIPGAKDTDCRAMCVGPRGDVWVAITEVSPERVHRSHLVCYRPGDPAPIDYGSIAVRNPDFTEFKGPDGQLLPFHAGFRELPDGAMTTTSVLHGVCQAHDGAVYVLAFQPYTLLKIAPPPKHPRIGMWERPRSQHK